MAQYSWETFTEDNRRECRQAHATLVLAPRELSKARLTRLLKELLAKSNVIFGVSTEGFVRGFEGQPQFTMLSSEVVASFEQKAADAHSSRTLALLHYPQSAVDEVIRAVRPARVVVVRGSYQYVFHRSSTHALLSKRAVPYELVSPFCDEHEASEYLAHVEPLLPTIKPQTGDEAAMFQLADVVAKRSFDYSFQTGAVLAHAESDGTFRMADAACNEVVPFQTYALWHGNAREMHEAAFQDTTHYDTIHAEMNLLARAATRGDSLTGAHLFINLLPCPACARTLCKTGIAEVVYREMHSDGYALELFAACGIKTRRMQC